MNEAAGIQFSANAYAITAFVGYLLLVTAIGVLSARFSSKGMAEYFLAGRKLNRFVVALSAVLSGRSSWLLLGVTGMAYVIGAAAVWAVVGYIVVEMFLFLFYARRLRNFSGSYNCITCRTFLRRVLMIKETLSGYYWCSL